MIKFITGTAEQDIGAGVRNELISLLERTQNRRIVYIVPEQFEYETERAVYQILDRKGLLTRSEEIKITTFSRMSDELLKMSGDTRPLADDIVKSIVMHKTLAAWKGALTALSGISAKNGFCGKMVQTVSSLKISGISARDLELSLEAMKFDDKLPENSPVVQKLRDTAILYTEYEALLENYIDKPDVITLAADFAAKSSESLLCNADVFVDCFNDFTAGQAELLSNLIGKAASITLGFVTNYDSEFNVFRTANTNISRLYGKARDEEIPVTFENTAPEKAKSGTAMFELSRKLFQGGRAKAPANGAVELISAANIYTELDYVCAKIKQLTAEKGLRYREIALLCTDIGMYGRFAEAAFKKYEIPMFCDKSESILYQPLINAVIALLNALRSFSLDSVMSCVKTGFFSKWDEEKGERVGLSDNDINVFESYVYEWSLETKHLKSPFTFKNPQFAAEGKEDLDAIQAEQIRKSVVEPILKLRRKLPSKNGKINGAKLTELLYGFLTDEVGINRALFAKSTNSDGTLDNERVNMFQRLWDTLIGIFNTLHAELSDSDVTAEEYYRLFREICAGTSLASPPKFVDCVLVGDIDRTRADNIKAAFIVGASYDAFPTPAVQNGIFSQYETELIRESIVRTDGERREICLKSAREQYELALYRAYRSVTLPTEYLCVSCPSVSPGGEQLRQSDVMGEIRRVFGELEIMRDSDFDAGFYCSSIEAAKQRFAFGLYGEPRENELIRQALELVGCGDFTEQLLSVKSSRTNTAAHSISRDIARKLFPHRIGATAIEELDKCKFKFFCRYGLGIDERTQRSFNRIRRGDAVHFVLERVLNRFSGNIGGLFSLSRSDFYRLSIKYLEEYCLLETANDFEDDMRTHFLFRNLANSAADVLITIQSEFYSRRYRPQFFELSIDEKDNPKYFTESVESENAVGGGPSVPGQTAEVPLPTELYTDIGESEKDSENDKMTENERRSSDKYIVTKPLVIRLPDGMTVTVTGRIDRVDAFSVSEDGTDAVYVRTVDYKSSVKSFDLNLARNGINIQMLLYLFALCDANKDNPCRIRAGGVSYVPSNNSGALGSEMPPYKLLALNHRESGLVIRDEATEADLKEFIDFTLRRITEEDGKAELMCADAEQLTEERQREYSEYKAYLDSTRASFEALNVSDVEMKDFQQLQDEVLGVVRNNLAELFGGDVGAIPTVYSESSPKINNKPTKSSKNPCDYCEFKSICRNHGEVNNIEKYDKKEDKKDG